MGNGLRNLKRTPTLDLQPLSEIDMMPAEQLAPLLAAYAGFRDWPQARQKQVIERLVILTTQRLLSELPNVSDALRQQCRATATLEESQEAREAVWKSWAPPDETIDAITMGWIRARVEGFASPHGHACQAIADVDKATSWSNCDQDSAATSLALAALEASKAAPGRVAFQAVCHLWREALVRTPAMPVNGE